MAPASGLNLGQAATFAGSQTVPLEGGAGGAEYIAVVVNTSSAHGAAANFTVRGSGLAVPSAVLAATDAPSLDRLFGGAATPDAPELDRAFERRMRARERTALTPRIAGARAWRAAREASGAASSGAAASRSLDPVRRDGSIPVDARVGDIVTVNVNPNDPCTNPIYHATRVAAIGTHAIVLSDTLNPAGGFTSADFQRFAARFDTLVYPIDSAAFGPPTDIDANGHVGLIFTRAVNELTPANAGSFVGGFTFSRDLFPTKATQQAEACAGSNQGEFFYLLTPDPKGTINGNDFSTGFVDTNTTAVIAHEFQHLINAGRRIYVNDAADFEDTWLDEGLAHIAEELLFYREAGVGPKENLDTPQIRASQQRRSAFNLDMLGNSGRYRRYLLEPSTSSPYASDDSLSTRGAAWSLLRYLADRSGTGDNAFFRRLVNSSSSGVANLQAVYGSGLTDAVRNWSASHAVDDVATTAPEYQQPSWNWHSIYATLYGSYPLPVKTLAEGTPSSGSVVAGGSAFFRLSVPASGTASFALTGVSSTPTNLQLVVVRTR